MIIRNTSTILENIFSANSSLHRSGRALPQRARTVHDCRIDVDRIRMAKKRSHDEIENIDDVNGPMSSTSIHGAVVTLSPVKKGRKAMFFDGLLADETSQIRLVGFQGMQQRKLNDYHQKNIPVELENCEVKPARQGEGYEVMLKSSTLIKQSPKKLDVASLMADIATATKTIILSSLESLDVFQKVTVNIKVVKLKDETQVGGRVKRDGCVADGSGTARVSVWEGNVNAMEKDRSYCLKNFMVREYQSTKYLTMAKEGSEIIPIEDIGAVAEQGDRDDELWVINNVTVAGVPYFDMYKSCLQCKARVEPHRPSRQMFEDGLHDDAKVRSLPTTHHGQTHAPV